MYHVESGDIKVLVQCHGNSILKTSLRFEIAWVAAICVGVLFSKSPNVYMLLRFVIIVLICKIMPLFRATYLIPHH